MSADEPLHSDVQAHVDALGQQAVQWEGLTDEQTRDLLLSGHIEPSIRRLVLVNAPWAVRDWWEREGKAAYRERQAEEAAKATKEELGLQNLPESLSRP